MGNDNQMPAARVRSPWWRRLALWLTTPARPVRVVVERAAVTEHHCAACHRRTGECGRCCGRLLMETRS